MARDQVAYKSIKNKLFNKKNKKLAFLQTFILIKKLHEFKNNIFIIES